MVKQKISKSQSAFMTNDENTKKERGGGNKVLSQISY